MNTTPTQSLAIANTFVFTNDTDASLSFYRDTLGFQTHTDVTNGDFRWVTLTTPTQPDIEITIHNYTGGGLPMSDSDAEHLHDLLAKGLLAALIFRCDDVDAMFEHVRASGAEVLQEPADQFYGVRDCAFRDPAGNMVRFNQPLDQAEPGGCPAGTAQTQPSGWDGRQAQPSGWDGAPFLQPVRRLRQRDCCFWIRPGHPPRGHGPRRVVPLAHPGCDVG